VITPGSPNILSALAEHAPVVLPFIVCVYVCIIGVAAVVGSLHPDEKRRADAQKVLDRLLVLGRGRTRR